MARTLADRPVQWRQEGWCVSVRQKLFNCSLALTFVFLLQVSLAEWEQTDLHGQDADLSTATPARTTHTHTHTHTSDSCNESVVVGVCLCINRLFACLLWFRSELYAAAVTENHYVLGKRRIFNCVHVRASVCFSMCCCFFHCGK